MMNNPKVSVITVVYNGADTIEQTIKSVLGQTYKNLEYIIIDGASTDGTQKVIEKYQDSIACYVSEPDKGIYDAMNKGIKYATGDIIGIINSDDWYAGDAVEKAVAVFNIDEADVVYGKVLFGEKEGDMKPLPVYFIETLWYQMAVPHPSVFVKKHIYREYGLFDLQYGIAADYEFMLRLYSSKVKIIFIDEFMAYFRDGGVSRIQAKEALIEAYRISCKYIEKSENKKEVMRILSESGERKMFDYELRGNPNVLVQLLNKHFSIQLTNIVIFGTGKWGIRCCQILQDAGMEVTYFLDNRKSGEEIYGKSIRKPDDSVNGNRYILVAVVKDVEEIEKQLESLGEENYVTIGGLRREFWEEQRKMYGL